MPRLLLDRWLGMMICIMRMLRIDLMVSVIAEHFTQQFREDGEAEMAALAYRFPSGSLHEIHWIRKIEGHPYSARLHPRAETPSTAVRAEALTAPHLA